MGDYNSLCTRAGRYAPTGPARIETNKAALNERVYALRGRHPRFPFDQTLAIFVEVQVGPEPADGGPGARKLVKRRLINLDLGRAGRSIPTRVGV
ncbi:hypothetical protein E4U59_000090 [Claviceps monticola]|nr:hypothetical protein E4U59_000090 [Claviceps monticola]